MNVEKMSALTIKVNDMARSAHFYNRLLGLKVLYGVENAFFSSLQRLGERDMSLNLEKGHVTPAWGRIIFYDEDVDGFWAHMKEKNSVPQGFEMQHGVRGTSIYTIQTATNCPLPNQSARTASFVHFLDELLQPESQGMTWPS
jgi:catechol 2,3-dioxygenase-like lactoylglutathione lyase family enzyme